MSEQALPKLKYICLKSGLLQSKAISVDKVSLAEIYKTPSATPLPFPHPPRAAATNQHFLSSSTYLSWQKIHPTFLFSISDSFIRELCSPGQAEISSLSSHLCFHGRAISNLQWILPPWKHTISIFGKHPREQHPGCCISVFPTCIQNISEPLWVYRYWCQDCKHPRSLCIPQSLSKLYTVHVLITITNIKYQIPLCMGTHRQRYYAHKQIHLHGISRKECSEHTCVHTSPWAQPHPHLCALK